MSMTDELRAKLDELGVGHYDNDFNIGVGVRYTKWDNGGKREVRYEEWVNGTTRLDAGNVTPAQAIAATVGAEKLDTSELWPEWEQVLFANVTDEVAQDNLNECFHELLDKAVTIGAGTCRNKGFVDDGGWYFVCSKCGCEFEYGDFACEFAEGHGLGSPKFCPNCGAMVVVE